MDLKKRRTEFYQRFGILDETNPESEFNNFKFRILNIFYDIDYRVADDQIQLFCRYLGIELKRVQGKIQYAKNILTTLENEKDILKLFLAIETIFMLKINFSERDKIHRDSLYEHTKEAIALSDLNISIARNGNEIILYPRGEEVLDNGLVEVFSFLNTPSQEHMVHALKSYKMNTAKDFIKSAESLRRCLEEFLRFKFQNTQGLAKNIKSISAKLKDLGAPSEITSIISQIFSYLDDFFNNHSKHNDGLITEIENEYLLYQIGTLMRYIHKYFPNP